MLITTITYLSVGLIAGICSGLFGLGGGVIIVPMLVLLLNFSQSTATGTSLIAMLLPVGALGVWQYFKASKIELVHFKFGLLIACGMFLGAYLGSKLAISLNDAIVRRLFAILLVFVSIRLWLK